MQEQAKAKLESFGVTAEEPAFSFVAGLVQERIRNFCNIEEIPEGLEYTATDMVCGEYLNQMLLLGRLDAEVFPLEAVVKSLDAGDTKITFMDNASAEDKLAAFIRGLCSHESDLLAYRRLQW